MKRNLLLITIVFLGMSMGTNAQAIFAGSNTTYYLCKSGSVMATGGNHVGQLGDGTTNPVITPIPILTNGPSGITAIAGGIHSLFLKDDGSVWSCGYNLFGQLGDGTNEDRLTPVPVSGLSGITAIAGGGHHSLFLKNDGTVWACGRNDSGQLGDGTFVDRKIPIKVYGISGITAIAVVGSSSFFIKNDGTVWACGYNHGNLGDGTLNNRKIAVQVSNVSDIIAISGGSHTLFLKNDGTVWACGSNYYGQHGTSASSSTKVYPGQVSGLSGITALAAGAHHSLFLNNNGTVLVCGLNMYGALGDGTTTDSHIPSEVSGLSDITAIAAGGYNSLFLKNDGTVWACGLNGGSLGDGTYTDRHTPVQGLIDTDCLSVGIEEKGNHFSNLNIYPNPASSSIVIESKVYSPRSTVKIYNAVGQEVHQSSLDSYGNTNQSTIDISSLSSGVYFIRLFDGENLSQGKFVKD